MFVPEGYVPLLEAVSLVAAKIGGALMNEQEPADLPRLRREFAHAQAARMGASITDAAGHKYPPQSPRGVEEVAAELRAAQAAWASTQRRQIEATTQARTQLLHALGTARMAGSYMDPYGRLFLVPPESWRVDGGRAFSSGRISMLPFPWARDLPVYLPLAQLDRWGESATQVDPSPPTPGVAAPENKPGAASKAPMRQFSKAKMLRDMEAAAQAWKERQGKRISVEDLVAELLGGGPRAYKARDIQHAYGELPDELRVPRGRPPKGGLE